MVGLKNSSVITVVVLLILVGVLYLNIHERMDRMETRLKAAESALETLEPLRMMMAGLRPGPVVEHAYQAVQATGEPDVEENGRDDARAWCPAREDAGEEWLVLTYREAVETRAVRIVATCHPGAVTRLLAVADDGSERELWSGAAAGKDAAFVTEFPLVAPAAVNRLKVILDTSAVPGWNQIDAVGLLDRDGKEHWAEEAAASSHWSRESSDR